MDIEIRQASFWIAVFAAILAPFGIFSDSVQPVLVPAAIFVGGTAVLLFLRMLFSRTYRHGFNALSREMQGDAPWPGRRKKLSDPEWGMFGNRTGPSALQWLRVVFVFGLLPVVFLQHWIGMEVVALWAAGTFLATELSLMHAALSKSP